jgi:hypothetical protein
MTAEKFIDKKYKLERTQFHHSDVTELMRSYALQIAEKAVEEGIDEQILQNGLRPEIIRNTVHEVLTSLRLSIITRIKTEHQ